MIKNIVFSGCGSKIFMLVGVIKYLYEKDLLNDIENYVGTSGGAIVLFMLVIGYDYDSILDLFIAVKLDPLTKIDVDSILSFFDNYGINDLDECERILRIILKAKLGKSHITFDELYKLNNKKFVVCVTNIHRHETIYFSKDTHPKTDVIDALKMTICIPFFFKPIIFEGEYYLDGGITSHYPIEYIKTNLEYTFGVLIIADYYICKNSELHDERLKLNCSIKEKLNINSIEDYIFAILGCPIFKQIQDLYDNYKEQTLLIFDNKNSFDFNLTYEDKTKFIEIGYDKANCFTEVFLEQLNIEEKNKKKNEEIIHDSITKVIIGKEETDTKSENQNNTKKPIMISIGTQTDFN